MTAPIPEAAGINQGNESGESPRRVTIGILALQVHTLTCVHLRGFD